MREAVVHLNDRDLGVIGLDAVIATLREAGLKNFTELGPEGVHQVRVAEPIPASRLDDLEPVVWWEQVDESPAGSTYLWELDVPECEDDCPIARHSTAYEVSAVRPRGIDLSIIGSQDQIGQSVDQLLADGMQVNLERLSEYRGPETTLDRLTDRQREIVRTAHELGYYDVPRVASTADVAQAVGLDPSTVAEHLQRAERNLLGDVLISAE